MRPAGKLRGSPMPHPFVPLLLISGGVLVLLSCQPPANNQPVVIRGQVVGLEGASGSFVLTKFASRPEGVTPLSGARIYLSADNQGKTPLTAVAVSDTEGRFEWRIGPAGPESPYWLIVEHDQGERLATEGFNYHRSDFAEPLVVMKLRGKN